MRQDKAGPSVSGALAAELRTEVIHDPLRVERLAAEWDALEGVAVGPTLYASRAYMMAAWAHLRRPDDRWWVVTVRDARSDMLVGALPLWGRSERRAGVPITVLIHPGILEGERPGVLSSIDPDRVWSAAWAALRARRSHWHRWDLRELDDGAWPLQWARSSEARKRWAGWRLRVAMDTAAPWRAPSDPWPTAWSGDLPTGTVLEVISEARALEAAWPRYLALEQQMRAAGVPMAGTVQACAGAADLYAQWWPTLAAQGRVQLAFLRDESGGEDRVGLLRLKEPHGGALGVQPWGGEAAWLERHAAWRPGGSAATDLSALWTALQVRSEDGVALTESQRVHLPEPGSQPVPAQQLAFGRVRRTQQWSLWNLRNAVGLLMLLQSLVRSVRG